MILALNVGYILLITLCFTLFGTLFVYVTQMCRQSMMALLHINHNNHLNFQL